MGSNLYTSALSGMNAAQIGLATAQHNIVNANTPGFTRQEVLVGSRAPQSQGGSFIGQGVDVVGVKRIYDEFLTTQVRQEQTQASYLSSYHSLMGQIDNLIADPTAGASPAMQDFFNALNGVANNPESVPARQTLLGSAQFMVNRFQAIDQRLTDIANGVTNEITASVNTINAYAQQIAALNGSIKRVTATNQNGQLPNDLLDQRDQIINQLNKEIKVSVLAQPDGTATVFIGNGQALVIDEQAMSLRPVQSTTDPSKIDIAYLNGNKLSTIQQSSLQGGNLGAYLTFRDQSLEPARNALGRVAIGLADSINQQNRMGLDLNGVPGSNLFNIASPRVDNGALNTGTAVVTGAISDVSALTASDYRLSFNGTNYSMLRLSDNAVTDLGTTLPLAAVDGVTITVAGTMNAADSFLIRPTANAAGDLRVLTNDPAKIAAATPIRTSAALSNTGSANISSGTVNTPLPLDQNLLAPVKIVFNQPPTSYSLASTAASIGADIPDPVDPLVTGPTSVVTVSSTVNMAAGDPVAGGGFPAGTTILSIDSDGVTFVVQMPVGEATNPPAPATGQTLQIGSYAYTPGADISYNGWTLQISGTPNAGDTFDIAQNINASGDNRNVLLMADLQVQNLLVNGTVSFQGAYSQLVGEIGAKTHELDVTSQAQTAMLAHTIASQQSISGVNLDEEAANLLRYQHAYQAAAKAMQIAETMFDALLSLGR